MAQVSNTATLPEGPRIDKLSEIRPLPADLKAIVHVVGEKPSSGVCLAYTKDGQVCGRWWTKADAEADFAEAGLKWADFFAPNVQKREQAEALAMKRRTIGRPSRGNSRRGSTTATSGALGARDEREAAAARAGE